MALSDPIVVSAADDDAAAARARAAKAIRSTFDGGLEPEPKGDLMGVEATELETVKATVVELADAQRRRDEAIRAAAARGHTMSAIAAATGDVLSRARVHQIVRAG